MSIVISNTSSMPQRQGKRHGVRTNATIRRNEFEHHINQGDYLVDKSQSICLSIHKSRRWELLDDKENSLPIRKCISMYETSNEKISPYLPHYCPGGAFCDYDRARRYQSVNGKRSDVDLFQDENISEWLELSFENHEYPLKRQLRKKHDTPCRCCLYRGGVLLFRGRGDKSSMKTKGMKSYHRKDWNDEFNL